MYQNAYQLSSENAKEDTTWTTKSSLGGYIYLFVKRSLAQGYTHFPKI